MHSLSFRKHVFALKVKEDLTCKETSIRFGVSMRTLFAWQKRMEPKTTRNKPATKNHWYETPSKPACRQAGLRGIKPLPSEIVKLQPDHSSADLSAEAPAQAEAPPRGRRRIEAKKSYGAVTALLQS